MSVSHEKNFAGIKYKHGIKVIKPLNKVSIKHLKVVQASKVFFKSWQNWQKTIFLSILVHSFPKKKLQSLKSALEPVYHRNFQVQRGVKFHSWAETDIGDKSADDSKAKSRLAYDSSMMKAQWLLDHFNHMMRLNATFGEIYQTAYDEVATRALIPGAQRQLIRENHMCEDSNGKNNRNRIKYHSPIATSLSTPEFDINENVDDNKDDDNFKILDGEMKKYNLPSKAHSIEEMIEESISQISTININTDDYFSSNSSLGRPKGLPSINRTQSEILFGSHSRRNQAPLPVTKQVYKKEVLWAKDGNMQNAKSTFLRDLFKKQMTYIFDNLKHWNEHLKQIFLMRILEDEDDNTLLVVSKIVSQTLQAVVLRDRNIALLPDTFWFQVFRRLSSQDLINIEHTNKRLHYLANSERMWRVLIQELGESFGVPVLVNIIEKHMHANPQMDVDWREVFFLLRDHLMRNYDAERNKVDDVQVVSDPDATMYRSMLDLFDLHITKNRGKPPQRTAKKPVDDGESILDNQRGHDDLAQKFTKGRRYDKDVEEKNSNESKTKLSQLKKSNLSVNFSVKHSATDQVRDDRSDKCYDAVRQENLLTNSQVGDIGGQPDTAIYVDGRFNQMIKQNRLDCVGVKRVMVMETNGSPINCVLCHNGLVYTAATDRKIRVWTREGVRLQKFGETAIKGNIHRMAALPGDRRHEWHKMYAASWDTGVTVWDTFNRVLMRSLHGHTDTVSGIAVDDEYIVTCSHDRTIRVWRITDLKFVRVIRVHSAPVYAMAFHRKRIITGGAERLICVSCPRTGMLIDTLKGHQHRVRSIAAIKDLVLSGDVTGMLHMWSPNMSGNSYTLTRRIRAHSAAINAIKVASSRRIFTASSDRTIKEWDIVRWKCMRVMQGHQDEITDIDYCSSYLVSACKDGTTRVWWWDKSR